MYGVGKRVGGQGLGYGWFWVRDEVYLVGQEGRDEGLRYRWVLVLEGWGYRWTGLGTGDLGERGMGRFGVW